MMDRPFDEEMAATLGIGEDLYPSAPGSQIMPEVPEDEIDLEEMEEVPREDQQPQPQFSHQDQRQAQQDSPAEEQSMGSPVLQQQMQLQQPQHHQNQQQPPLRSPQYHQGPQPPMQFMPRHMLQNPVQNQQFQQQPIYFPHQEGRQQQFFPPQHQLQQGIHPMQQHPQMMPNPSPLMSPVHQQPFFSPQGALMQQQPPACIEQLRQQHFFPPPQQHGMQQQQQPNGGLQQQLQHQQAQQQMMLQQPQQHPDGGDRGNWQLQPYLPPHQPPYQQQPQQDQSAFLNYNQQPQFPITQFANRPDYQYYQNPPNQGVPINQQNPGGPLHRTKSKRGRPPNPPKRARSPPYPRNPPFFQQPLSAQSVVSTMDAPGPSNVPSSGFNPLNIPTTSNGIGGPIGINGNGAGAPLPMFSFSSSASGFNGQLIGGMTASNGGMPSTSSAPKSNGNAIMSPEAQAQAKLEEKKKKEAEKQEAFKIGQALRDQTRQLVANGGHGCPPASSAIQQKPLKMEGLPAGVIPNGGIRPPKQQRKPRSDVLVPSSNGVGGSNDTAESSSTSMAVVPLINDGQPVRRPDANATAGEIVAYLMSFNIQVAEAEFSSKALESLHKKIKDRPHDMETFIRSVETKGEVPGGCITVTRTLDGRLQVAGRKGFPHVIYTKIFRWQELHKNELKSIPSCLYGFENKAENEEHKPDAQVCVNPYHYERVTPQPGGSTLIDPSTGLLRINGIHMDDMMDLSGSSNSNLKFNTAESSSGRKGEGKKAWKRKGQPGDWPLVSLDDDDGLQKERDDVEARYRVESPVDDGPVNPPTLQQQAAHNQFMQHLQQFAGYHNRTVSEARDGTRTTSETRAVFSGSFPGGFPGMQPMQQQRPSLVMPIHQLTIAPVEDQGASNRGQKQAASSSAAPLAGLPQQSVQQMLAAPPMKLARADLPYTDPTGASTSVAKPQYPAHLQQEFQQHAAQAQIRPSPFNPSVAMPSSMPTFVKPVFPTPPVQQMPSSLGLIPSASIRTEATTQPPPSQAAIPAVRARSPPLGNPPEGMGPTVTTTTQPVTATREYPPGLTEEQLRILRENQRIIDWHKARIEKERAEAAAAALASLYPTVATQPPQTVPSQQALQSHVAQDIIQQRKPLGVSQHPLISPPQPAKSTRWNGDDDEANDEEDREQVKKKAVELQRLREKIATRKVRKAKEGQLAHTMLQDYLATLEPTNESRPMEKPIRLSVQVPMLYPPRNPPKDDSFNSFGGDSRPCSSKSRRPSALPDQLGRMTIKSTDRPSTSQEKKKRPDLRLLSEGELRTVMMLEEKSTLNEEERVKMIEMIVRNAKEVKEREEIARRKKMETNGTSRPGSSKEGRMTGLAFRQSCPRQREIKRKAVTRSLSPVSLRQKDQSRRNLSLERGRETSWRKQNPRAPYFLNAHPSLFEGLRLSNPTTLGGFGTLEIKTEASDSPKEADSSTNPPLSPQTISARALQLAKDAIEYNSLIKSLENQNTMAEPAMNGTEMMAHICNYDSEVSEPDAEMKEKFEGLILAGAQTLMSERLEQEIIIAKEELKEMEHNMNDVVGREVHSDDECYIEDMNNVWSYKTSSEELMEEKRKEIAKKEDQHKILKKPENNVVEENPLDPPTIWNADYTDDNDKPSYSRLHEWVGMPPNPRVVATATGPGSFGSKGPHKKPRSRLTCLEWSVQQIVKMMEKVTRDPDVDSTQYMLCCQHYAGMMEKTKGAASLDPQQKKLVDVAIEKAQEMGGGAVCAQQLHIWDISKIFANHMMTTPERRELNLKRKREQAIDDAATVWQIDIEAEVDKVVADTIGTDAEGVFSSKQVQRALEERQKIINGAKIVPDALMEINELKNPLAKEFSEFKKKLRKEAGLDVEMDTNDGLGMEEEIGEDMDIDPLIPVIENLFTVDDLFDLLNAPSDYLKSFQQAVYGDDPPPVDFDDAEDMDLEVKIPPLGGDTKYEPFDGIEREHDDPNEFGEERPPFKKNCRCNPKTKREHCSWGKHSHYQPGVSREIVDAAFLLYKYRIKRKKSNGPPGKLYDFSKEHTCPKVCLNRIADIEPHSAKTKPEGYCWAAVNYCERDKHIGLLKQISEVNYFIDGGFDSETEQRLCVNSITTDSDREVQDIKSKIGSGVRISVKDDGSMWVRCLSRYPIFVSSTFLDREAGSVGGDCVHKIYPGTSIKAFDLLRARRTILQMYDYQYEAKQCGDGYKVKQELPYPLRDFNRRELKSISRIGADDMQKQAVVKISFIKGWGPEFECKKVCDTPVWMEVVNNRACEFIDHMINERDVSYPISEVDSSDLEDY